MPSERPNKIKQVMDMIVSTCLVVVSITIVVFAIQYFRSSHDSRTTFVSRTSSLKKGEVINIGASPALKPDQRTLVIALQTGCKYCKESIPLYRELSRRAKSLNLKLIFAFQQPKSIAEDYLSANGIRADDIRQIAFNDIKVEGTPTMILLNSQNKIISFWTGKIEDSNLPTFYSALGS